MTDKIEIPEEVKLIVKDYYEYKQKESTINNVGPVYEFLNNIIQKQDNEIGVGDFYYYMHEDDFKVSDCENTEQARIFNDDPLYKKVPKELAKQLEKLRKGGYVMATKLIECQRAKIVELQAENKVLKDTLKQIQVLCIGVDLVTTAEDTIKLIYKALPEGLIPEIEPPTPPKDR